MGKLALTPFVIWATFSLYVAALFPEQSRKNLAVRLGLFMGALIAGACALFSLVILDIRSKDFEISFLVPLFVAVWHGSHCWNLVKANGWRPIPYILTFLGSIPFWIPSVYWARHVYRGLPETPPSSCFVVTAASRGHRQLVGPFTEIIRHNGAFSANQQLVLFWELEQVWNNLSPRSHRLFRSYYNRLGPKIARRVVSPWVADAVYLMLIPFEFLAHLVITAFGNREKSHARNPQHNGANK